MASETSRFRRRVSVGGAAVVAGVAVVGTLSSGMSAQVMHMKEQNIVPVYEGWEKNSDGSFDLLFGHFNRNHMEEFDIPVGPDNYLSPGEPDQGQPTHFFPQRSRFLFRVRVPSYFGDRELVWTLTGNGKTEKTYATLNPGYFIDDIVIMNNNGAGGSGDGDLPTRLSGRRRHHDDGRGHRGGVPGTNRDNQVISQAWSSEAPPQTVTTRDWSQKP